MCGSYRICFSNTKIGKSILDEASRLNLNNFSEGDVFPKKNVLTIVPKKNKITLDVKRWGIDMNGKTLINARSETMDTKVFYKDMVNKRCAVPVSCFYEWKDSKRYSVFNKKDELFYLAGIYNENNELLIVTGPSENELAKIHDRSPFIFNKNEMLQYLAGNKELKVNNGDLLIE